MDRLVDIDTTMIKSPISVSIYVRHKVATFPPIVSLFCVCLLKHMSLKPQTNGDRQFRPRLSGTLPCTLPGLAEALQQPLGGTGGIIASLLTQ